MQYDKWLKNRDLEYRDGDLFFSNLNTIELGKKYGTPCYLINEQMIRKRYKELKNVISSVYQKNDIHFAVKANSNISILKILDSEGSFFDCTSNGEIYICLKVGIPSEKIIYTGNMFTNDDFEYAIKNNITINLDSLSQLKRLDKVYNKLGKEKQLISFRINPEFGAGHHLHNITAGKEVKFGILENQVLEAYKKAKDLGFRNFGIHQHIGSGIINPNDFEMAVEKFMSIIKMLVESISIEFKFVDFGGGLGIPYRPEEDPFDLKRYKEIVIRSFKDLVDQGNIGHPNLKIEPGRYLSAESSIILTQINTIKDNGYKLFAGVDAGFNILVRPAMYGSYHHIIPCKVKKGKKILKYDIVGPICESGDVLGRERELPELEEEDYLAILDTGAYGFIMSSNYNSRPKPAEILIIDGNLFQIREAETYQDLLRNQIIPDHLK
jgi:diaminopimelate decarboxylase